MSFLTVESPVMFTQPCHCACRKQVSLYISDHITRPAWEIWCCYNLHNVTTISGLPFILFSTVINMWHNHTIIICEIAAKHRFFLRTIYSLMCACVIWNLSKSWPYCMHESWGFAVLEHLYNMVKKNLEGQRPKNWDSTFFLFTFYCHCETAASGK